MRADNAVAQLVTTGALTNPLMGFCNRCEHDYQFTAGTPSTTTTGAANTQGATAITVASGTGFSTVGAFVVIDTTSVDGGAEIVTVSTAGSGTNPDRQYAAAAHPRGRGVGEHRRDGAARPDDVSACRTPYELVRRRPAGKQ